MLLKSTKGKRVPSLEIPGEYQKVSRLSRDPHRLQSAHQTPCTQEAAQKIVGIVDDLHDIEVSVVRFRERACGRAYYNRALSLPATPGAGFGCLRVGIVLHELAHLVTWKQYGRPQRRAGTRRTKRKGAEAHGQVFVSILDDLIEMWAEGKLLRGA